MGHSEKLYVFRDENTVLSDLKCNSAGNDYDTNGFTIDTGSNGQLR